MSNTKNSAVVIARDVLELEAQALLSSSASLRDDFNSIVDFLLRDDIRRIVVMGIGKSGLVGKKIAATLASTGSPATFVHPGEAGHGDLGMITSGDVVIAISQSGSANEIRVLLPYLTAKKIPLIAMTGNASSPIAEKADYIIDTSISREACPHNLAPTSSTTLTMALGDGLAVALSSLRGFTPNEFALTHPLGALGRQLVTTVSQIMVSGSDNPEVNEQASIADCIVEMSRCGIGFTNIVKNQKVRGVFTDGDLRRVLGSSATSLEISVSNYMSTNFQTINEDSLASEALDLMRRYKVNALPVVSDSDELIGAINLRMLIAYGL